MCAPCFALVGSLKGVGSVSSCQTATLSSTPRTWPDDFLCHVLREFEAIAHQEKGVRNLYFLFGVPDSKVPFIAFRTILVFFLD